MIASGDQTPADKVLVVGGAIGGRRIVEQLSRMGSHVIIADQNRLAAEQLKAKLLSEGHSESHLNLESVDATDPDSVAELADRLLETQGYLNHLISVLGGAAPVEWQGLAETPIADLEQTTRLNLLSHQFLMRAMKPLLMRCPERNRSILMMGSINAQRGFDLPSYSAAKAGLMGLMYGAAREYTQDQGIRINIVAPGTMYSERTAKSPRNIETLLTHSLLGEMPEPEEIAEACITLTHRLPHCTQQLLTVDSGQTAYGPPHNDLFR